MHLEAKSTIGRDANTSSKAAATEIPMIAPVERDPSLLPLSTEAASQGTHSTSQLWNPQSNGNVGLHKVAALTSASFKCCSYQEDSVKSTMAPYSNGKARIERTTALASALCRCCVHRNDVIKVDIGTLRAITTAILVLRKKQLTLLRFTDAAIRKTVKSHSWHPYGNV